MASKMFTRPFSSGPSRAASTRRRLATHAPSPSTSTSTSPSSPSSSSSAIPVVDFGYFLSGSPLHRTATARQVVEAFKTVGFVYLGNTKVGEGKERQHVFDMSRRFFELPPEVKASLAWETPESNRGYVAQGRERVTQATDAQEILRLRESSPDFKETMEIGRDFESQYQNRWPSESDLPGFKETMNGFFGKCHDLHLEVMRSIALGLNIGESYFDKLCNDQSHNLRLLSYPPVPQGTASNNRAGAHTDYGAATLLFQDDIGGLEVQDPSTGEFVPATPIPDTVVVNVGDLLSRWSNSLLRSTLHRVVLPPHAASDPDMKRLPRPKDVSPQRWSIAFFGNPNMDAVVEALPGTGDPRYPPVKTEDYLVSRLKDTYT